MQVRRIAVAAMALLLAGCVGEDGRVQQPEPGFVLRMGIVEPEHLIPSNASTTSDKQVLSALFSPLVGFDSQNRPHEVAAQSITSTDSKLWIVRLKPGYAFHNGEPVTADNYLDAWAYAAHRPNSQWGSHLFAKIKGYAAPLSTGPDGPTPAKPRKNPLAGLTKVDNLTLKVTLAKPFRDFKAMLGDAAFYPLPKAAFSASGAIVDGFEDAVIGQGPFKMKGTWERGKRIEVERHDAFPGAKPKIAGVEFRIFREPTAQYADLIAGGHDVMPSIPRERLTVAPGDLGERFKKSPLSTLQLLVFPTFLADYANADVRRAISMAIHRDEIVNAIFLDSEMAARSFVSPVVPGYRENSCGAACTYDPATAKRLYAAAGGPQRLRISYNTDDDHKAWVDATCGQLRVNLGVECAGTAAPNLASLLAKAQGRQLRGMFRIGWQMTYPSMEDYLRPLYSSDGEANFHGYRNPTFDDLVDAGTRQPTDEGSVRKYQQAEDLLARDMPAIPLRFSQNVFGHSERVRNVEFDQFGGLDLGKIEGA